MYSIWSERLAGTPEGLAQLVISASGHQARHNGAHAATRQHTRQHAVLKQRLDNTLQVAAAHTRTYIMRARVRTLCARHASGSAWALTVMHADVREDSTTYLDACCWCMLLPQSAERMAE